MVLQRLLSRLGSGLVLSFTVLLLCIRVAVAQTDAAMEESEDTHYYDFWPGTWVEVVDGVVDTSATIFTVRRSVSAASYEEDWRLVYDGESHESKALRAWDQVNERWMFTWISDNGLFQVWEGQKVGDDWYIVKEFNIDGEIILSRQAWIPEGDHRLRRVLQRSTDGGETWVTRYEGEFALMSNE
jgi:hypothetical protein